MIATQKVEKVTVFSNNAQAEICALYTEYRRFGYYCFLNLFTALSNDSVGAIML
jgi:hypothetical protein